MVNREGTEVEAAEPSVVAWSGELDAAECRAFDAALRDAVAGGRLVHLDLTAVTFFGSTAVRTLVVAQRAARDAGGDLRIAAMSEQVRRVLGLTDLLDDFAVG